MKRVRWGLVMTICAGAFVVSGCQVPWKVIKRSELESLRQIERLNAQQAGLVTALTHEKERLSDQLSSLTAERDTVARERDALRGLVQDKEKLLALQQKAFEDLTGKIEGLEGEGETFATWEGIGVRYEADLLFAPGKAALRSAGQKAIRGLAAELKQRPNRIRISGYTDSDPIKHSGWKSNFELSAARALSVLNLLAREGVDPARMHFAGYGEYRLILGDGGKENKKKSRRAEILLLNETASDLAAEETPEK